MKESDLSELARLLLYLSDKIVDEYGARQAQLTVRCLRTFVSDIEWNIALLEHVDFVLEVRGGGVVFTEPDGDELARLYAERERSLPEVDRQGKLYRPDWMTVH